MVVCFFLSLSSLSTDVWATQSGMISDMTSGGIGASALDKEEEQEGARWTRRKEHLERQWYLVPDVLKRNGATAPLDSALPSR